MRGVCAYVRVSITQPAPMLPHPASLLPYMYFHIQNVCLQRDQGLVGIGVTGGTDYMGKQVQCPGMGWKRKDLGSISGFVALFGPIM